MNDPAPDPAAGTGQQVRAAAMQAAQTYLMLQQLQRGRHMEARSAAEHATRQARAHTAEDREREIHAMKVRGYSDRATWGAQLHDLDMAERQVRITRGDTDLHRRNRLAAAAEERETALNEQKLLAYTEREARAEQLHELDVADRQARIARGQTDLERRENESSTRQQRENDLHTQKMAGYTDRDTRAGQLHYLDIQERLQRMVIRARAADFTAELASHPSHGGAEAAAYSAGTPPPPPAGAGPQSAARPAVPASGSNAGPAASAAADGAAGAAMAQAMRMSGLVPRPVPGTTTAPAPAGPPPEPGTAGADPAGAGL